MENNFKKITCPECGREYLPNEIYYPTYFLGRANDVVRNKNGKIEFYTGENMELEEEFTCECGCTFKVLANVEFQTKRVNEDFEDFTVSLEPDKEDLFGVNDDNNN